MTDKSDDGDVSFSLRAKTAQIKKDIKETRLRMKKAFEDTHETTVDIKTKGVKKANLEKRKLAEDEKVKLKTEIDKSKKQRAKKTLEKLKKEGGIHPETGITHDGEDFERRGKIFNKAIPEKRAHLEIAESMQDSIKQGGIDAGQNIKKYTEQGQEGFSDNVERAAQRLKEGGGNIKGFQWNEDSNRWTDVSGRYTSSDDVKEAIAENFHETDVIQIKRAKFGKGVVHGKTGRDVTGSSGRGGTTRQGRVSRGFRATSRDPSVGEQIGDIQKPTGFQKSMRKIKKQSKDFKENFDISEHHMGRMKEHSGKFFKNFKKYSPNIMMWWKVVAMLLPMMIALKVQAMGVKMALQSIAGAGLGMIGGGLLGHGEAIEDSVAIAERRINLLKRELHQAFRPILQEFAPISERFLSTLPERVRPLVDALSEITAFEGAFNRLFDDAIHYAAEFVRELSGRADQFEQVGRRFLALFFDKAMGFIDWLTETMTQEQDVMERMIDVFQTVLGVIWRVLLVFTQLASSLSWFFNIINKVTAGLSSKLWPALIMTLVVGYKAIVMFNTLRNAIIALQGTKLASFFAGMIAPIKKAIAALIGLQQAYSVAAVKAAAFKIAATGGLAAISLLAGHAAYQSIAPSTSDYGGGAGGMPGGHGTSGGAAPVYNTDITVEGNAGKKEVRRIEDSVLKITDERDSRNEARDK